MQKLWKTKPSNEQTRAWRCALFGSNCAPHVPITETGSSRERCSSTIRVLETLLGAWPAFGQTKNKPCEFGLHRGDYSKIGLIHSWQPHVTFCDLIVTQFPGKLELKINTSLRFQSFQKIFLWGQAYLDSAQNHRPGFPNITFFELVLIFGCLRKAYSKYTVLCWTKQHHT